MKVTLSLFALFLFTYAAPPIHAQSAAAGWSQHAVFVMTNSAKANEVIAYSRSSDGSLVEGNHYATGGRGSGGTTDPLGSQGSLRLSQDHSLLFAVNAGTGDISVFRVYGTKLDLAQVIPSGGSAPVAIAQRDNLVYVINFAGNSNVVGFYLDEAGRLIRIPDSIRYLSTANSGPSSLAFSPDGRFLLVTEKITNDIDAFPVKNDGSLGTPKITTDPIPGLFDVIFSPGGAALIVQMAPPGGTGTSSISSFLVEEDGSLSPVTAELPLLGLGSCWVVLTPDGQFAFTSNSASSSISAVTVGSSGNLAAVPGTVVASLATGSVNLEIVVSDDAKYAYTLNSGSGNVGVFAIQPDGKLKLTSLVPGVKATHGFEGMAAY